MIRQPSPQPDARPPHARPALAAEEVNFAFTPGRPVLDGVSAEVHPATITGVIGPNGAGKSTLLRVLGGLLRPQRGSVLLDGRDISQLPPRSLAPRLAYLAQRPAVAFAFTVRQVVRLGLYARRGAETDDAAIITHALETVDALDLIDRPFGALSVGQQQRITLARALAQLDIARARPETTPILLADEPASAMDPKHAAHTMSILRSLAQRGAAVVVVLHDLTLAARALDGVIALGPEGRVLAQGPTRETLTPDLLHDLFEWNFRWIGDGAVLVPHDAPGA
jgi:iron complex transport system ATP-binding protein